MTIAISKVKQGKASNPKSKNNRLLREKYKKISGEKRDYIYSSEFETIQLDEVKDTAVLDENTTKPLSQTSDHSQTSYFATLYSIPLLNSAGETALFRKYNFLKYLVDISFSELDAGRPSVRKLNRIETLMAEAEETRDILIESNLRLVVSIARKYCTPNVTFEELVSEGNTILINAVEKFDYDRGFRFSTYVTHSVQRHFYRYLNQAHKRKQTELGSSQEMLHEIAGREYSTLDCVDTSQADLLLKHMNACLDEREQYILRERIGLSTDGVTRTYQSLSDDLGICKERVRQVFNAAVQKLRQLALEMKLEFPH